MRISSQIVVSAVICLLLACQSSNIYYGKHLETRDIQVLDENKLVYQLYLLGDVGDDSASSAPVLTNLKGHLDSSDQNQTGVVFLGDNIYYKGLHKKDHPLRPRDEARINVQLDAVKDFEGRIAFIPGNHDWSSGGQDGLANVKRQEKYIQRYLDRGNVFRPSHGCPGPDVVELADGLILIIIDTQWWLHPFERSSGEKDGCDVRTSDELIAQFTHLMKKYRDQNVIVAGHHPLYSQGTHGGHFTIKDHIFPITSSRRKIYVPLPGLGSIYPYYRKFIGLRQDISNPLYQDMKRKLLKVMNEYDNVVYASGHEHNLQYIHKNAVHQVVSGSGSKVTSLNYSKQLEFGAREVGYSRINYYENGEIWLDFMVVNSETGVEHIAYKSLIFKRKATSSNIQITYSKPSYAGMKVVVIPDSIKAAGPAKEIVFGSLNRDIWTQPIEVPYLDIHFEKGGLTPIKKGGGMQTLSLRMQGGDGKQYVLRGVKKTPTYFVEKALRGTVSQDIIYDGIAASYPFATVTMPKMSDASNVYYANSKLVYVPKDSVLGDYLEEFGGRFCIFEERPDGDMDGFEQFGSSRKVMSTPDAIENIQSNYNHVVDKNFAVRTRLFDMLIGDFDRHDDQWRWAAFDTGEQTVYRPIPRDRDQAYFKPNGLIMNLAKARWLLWYVQPFDAEIKSVGGLNLKGRHFDRSFLTEASREDWIAEARYIQTNLTDSIIELAIKDLPVEAYAISGVEITRKLKARRDNLIKTSISYYELLSKEVDIVGTFDDDYFEVIRRSDNQVEVNLYPRKKGDKVEAGRYYHRIFNGEETKSISLYGIEGHDEYKVSGDVEKSILVRIIAGSDKDKIEDNSNVSGLKKHTIVYEIEGKNKLEPNAETKVVMQSVVNPIDYNRKQFNHDILSPGLSLGSNANDGFYIGPGFKLVKHKFTKAPYSQLHKGYVNYTFLAQGLNAHYEHDFVDVFKAWNFIGAFDVNLPLAYQYYGRTFEKTAGQGDVIRLNQVTYNPSMRLESRSLAHRLDIGLSGSYINFEPQEHRLTKKAELRTQHIAGLVVDYDFMDVDNELNPNQGIHFHTGAGYHLGLKHSGISYLQYKASLSLYLPLPALPKQATVAIRSAFIKNWGDFAFYQANFINGLTNFRGVPRNRYAGKTIQYNNLDFRMSLVTVRNKLAPVNIGFLVHADAAHLYVNVIQDEWLYSYGGGLYIKVLEMAQLVATYSVYNETGQFMLGSKFFF